MDHIMSDKFKTISQWYVHRTRHSCNLLTPPNDIFKFNLICYTYVYFKTMSLMIILQIKIKIISDS